ncbi:MAG: sensor domain-containing diguanylate cyclase [bacterium]
MDYQKQEDCFKFMTQLFTLLKTKHQQEEALQFIVDHVTRIYRCQTCAIIVINPKTEYLNVSNNYGLSHTFVKGYHQKITVGKIGELLWTGKPLIVTDQAANPELAQDVLLEHEYGSAVCVQISVDLRTTGYLHVDSKEADVFSAEDLPFLQLCADIAAIAIQRSRLFDDILHMDRIDHETGLERYTAFLDHVPKAIDREKNFQESFALLLLDVDNFKYISSTYGHESSRLLLRQLADLIRTLLRNVDTAGRYGFDELVVLRANARTDEAMTFANELRDAVERAAFTNHNIKTTVSIGVVIFPEDAKSMDELLLNVKQALFEAQRSGRNSVYHLRAHRSS